ncbi:hypothetical protein FOC1_g10007996 [Fusarium oxysporum f. sp. cubense race 1]|uniref:Uncharacterized protein n=1 Tax=Fusarium oxysporum f. sp. cubense (strain race 1) TaxID=1229664 RepID=N4U1L1_FUSC1|nr:hypothetical protein FOC1_g10007996 [Fusarium oxysporum f. sp. cubense race 1]
MITPSYQNFVEYRARANPCVSRLSNYLQHECVGKSKVTYLDYTNQSLEPRRIDVPEDEISQLLNMSPSVSTRFVFVENISPGLMIPLGEKLMVMVATSLIQLLDSRRSILEAINTKRLTFLALIFVPLAWVSSLFSISDGYNPGHDLFWVYFATALPVPAVVLLLSALPYGKIAIAAKSYKAQVRNNGMRLLGELV